MVMQLATDFLVGGSNPGPVNGGVVARCAHGARTVRARCAHGSMFLGWLPNLYPVEWPP